MVVRQGRWQQISESPWRGTQWGVGAALLGARCQPQGLRGGTGFGGRTVVVVTLDAGEVEREHSVVVCVDVPR